MWRISGSLARALNRFHVTNIPGCVHGEAEALGPSSLLPLGQNAGDKRYTLHSPGSQNDQDGREQKKKGTYKSCTGQLHQCNILDAFGWGAIAVFFLHLARQASFQNATSNPSPEGRCFRRSYLKQILFSLTQSQTSSVKRSIFPEDATVSGWNGLQLQKESVEADCAAPESLSPDSASGYGSLHLTFDEGESQIDASYTSTPGTASDSKDHETCPPQQILEPEEDLGETLQFAASRLLEVTESSLPIALNIFGIVSARDSTDYRSTFRFFQESAKNGYSKAQYNTGVCYEQGKGVAKDMTKAAEYYLLAAKSGHDRAKYRYARYLLHAQATTEEDTQAAVEMLHEAAKEGLKEAQAYLGVLYSKEPHMDLQKAAHFLWMAAENGDVQSRYYLGVCYEKGFGVPASRQEALRHFERASKMGHDPARQKLLEISQEQTEGASTTYVSLRAASSSPCLPVLGGLSILTRASNRFSANRTNSLGLPHSLSTGNLLLMSPADGSNFNLVPHHANSISLPLTSLRAIGVG
ncbi:death ligand signal enhancer [Pelodytes ibericus]